MAEATVQLLTTSLPGEEPFIGDLGEGEICINSADGRIWTGDSIGTPIELGGAVKNAPIGSLLFSKYLDVDITSADNLPISNTDPLNIPSGFYREERILLRFSQTPLENLQTYFDYPVNWGLEASWKYGATMLNSEGNPENLNFGADNPIDFYRAQGRTLLVELSSFGPSTHWMGRLLWVNTIPSS